MSKLKKDIPQKINYKKILLFFFFSTFFITSCRIKACDKPAEPTPTPTPSIFESCTQNKKCNINLWYPFGNQDTEAIYQALAKQYSQGERLNITITTINKNNFSNYISQLRDKQNTSEAPDIYLVRNDWLNKFEKEKIVPLTNKALQNASAVKDDAYVKPEDLIEKFSPGFKENFVEEKTIQNTTPTTATEKTAAKELKIYGMPVFYQGLALFINKKIINDYNRANQDSPISMPSSDTPLTWGEFGTMALKLTKTQEGWLKIPSSSPSGDIKINIDPETILSFGTALGTTYNIPYSTDIFSILLQQEGVPIVSSDYTKALFDDTDYLESSAKVLAKYVSYSKLWSPRYESSIKAFAEGKVAMIFARSYNVPEVTTNPEVDLLVAPIPQLQKEQKEKWITDNYYWAFVVNKDCKNPDLAWDFLKFLTSKDNLKKFSVSVQQPSTRVDIIEDFKIDKQYDNYFKLYGTFNEELKYAKSFYKGKPEVVDSILKDTIDYVNQNKDSNDIIQVSRQAIDQAGEKVTQNLQSYPYN